MVEKERLIIHFDADELYKQSSMYLIPKKRVILFEQSFLVTTCWTTKFYKEV